MDRAISKCANQFASEQKLLILHIPRFRTIMVSVIAELTAVAALGVVGSSGLWVGIQDHVP